MLLWSQTKKKLIDPFVLLDRRITSSNICSERAVLSEHPLALDCRSLRKTHNHMAIRCVAPIPYSLRKRHSSPQRRDGSWLPTFLPTSFNIIPSIVHLLKHSGLPWQPPTKRTISYILRWTYGHWATRCVHLYDPDSWCSWRWTIARYGDRSPTTICHFVPILTINNESITTLSLPSVQNDPIRKAWR